MEEAVIGAASPIALPASLERGALDQAAVTALVAGGAAHELNNVLAQLLLQIEVLEASALSEETEELLGSMRSGLRRGVDIAHTLLRQAQAESGLRVPLNPKYLVTGIQKRSRSLFGSEVGVTSRYPDALPAIAAEPRVLTAALIRLCRFALESTGGTNVALLVEVADQDGAQRVVFAVSARDFRPIASEGEVQPTDPRLGDVVTAVTEHGGRVLAAPAAGAIRVELPVWGEP